MRSITLAAVSAAALLASACASNPPAPTPPPAEPAAPVAARPAPVTPPPAPSGPVAGSKADFEAKATDRVYFDYDQYNLDDADRRALATQVAWLKQFPAATVQVEGNADERGTREYNIALGARRANAVAEYLKGQGVSGDRVSTISFGKDRPLDPGHNESAWSRNRNAYTNVVSGAVS